MPDSKDWGLTERLNKRGRLELVDKDDAGNDYVALECASAEFTERDEKILTVSDRERSTPRGFADFFVNEKQKHEDNLQAVADQEWEDAAVTVGQLADDNRPMGRALTGAIQKLFKDDAPEQVRRPATKRYTWDRDTNQYVLVTERAY